MMYVDGRWLMIDDEREYSWASMREGKMPKERNMRYEMWDERIMWLQQNLPTSKFEKQNWILQSSVHYIAVTPESFLYHHTDTVGMLCENVYLYVEIC